MMKRSLYIIAAAAAGLVFMRIVTAWKQIRYKIANWRFSSLDFQSGQVIIAFDFVIYNPTSVNLDIDQLAGDILLEGYPVGAVNTAPMRTIYAKSESIIPVQVAINSTEAIQRTVSLLSYSTLQQWVATFVGELMISGHRLPVRYSYELKDLKV